MASKRTWRVLGLAGPVLAVALLSADRSAQAPSAAGITLAWDPNPEPTVIGYLVHVGTTSGRYTETFDAGDETSFTLASPVPGQRYYFAVSAYADGPIVGPRSVEVSAVAFARAMTATASAAPAARRPSVSESATGVPPVLCAESAQPVCYTRRDRAAGLGAIAALAPTPDGRVWLVEDHRRVRLVRLDGLAPHPVYQAADADTRLTGVVVSPVFGRTRQVFVGMTRARGDRTREFSVVRLREVLDTLGEPAAIVAGLTVWGPDDPQFTIDADGRIYVAMPAAGGVPGDPYAGHVLRFDADGSVPVDHRHRSPVLAHGYAKPRGLAWDGRHLWLAGTDERWSAPMARLALDALEEQAWPLRPVAALAREGIAAAHPDVRALAVDRQGADAVRLAWLDSANRLHDERVDDTAVSAATLVWTRGEVPEALAVGPEQELYVAVRSLTGSTAIVELRAGRRDF